MAYVELPNGDALFQPRLKIEQTPFAATKLLQAVLAVRTIFEPPLFEGALPTLVAEYRKVTDAVRENDGLPAVDWPR